MVLNIPDITQEEWPEIFRHCNNQEFPYVINLYQNPERRMPNEGTGRNTPFKDYYQFLDTSFNERV